MSKVARYAARTEVRDEERAQQLWNDIETRRQRWVHGKGELRAVDGEGLELELAGGDRVADVTLKDREAESGTLRLFRLREPRGRDRFFETTIQWARAGTTLAVDAGLQLGYEKARISPSSFEARCPEVIRSIFELDTRWCIGNTEIRAEGRELRSAVEGRQLGEAIWSRARGLPYVVVSELQQLTLHPELVDRLADDLCGLARVFRISNEASSGLREVVGKEWACYNGAVRVYWPLEEEEQNPYRHELWTRERMMRGAADTLEASRRINDQLRRTILGLSTITIPTEPLVEEIHRDYRQKRRRARIEEAEEESEWKDIAREFAGRADEADKLEEENERLKDKVEQLEEVIQYLQEEERPEEADAGDLMKPESEVPPETVAESVERAREKFGDCLTFGGDVAEGVESLARDAGPPETILRHLRKLYEVGVELRRDEALGATIVKWLEGENVSASPESESVRTSDRERQKRTWRDGKGRRFFNMHTKPNEAAGTGRCARIYFDWDDDREEMIIGWVGRHP